jgi:hypothetical protein
VERQDLALQEPGESKYKLVFFLNITFLGRTGTGRLFLFEAETDPVRFFKINFFGPDPAPP